MKDFIISKRPVMLARHPMLRSFVVTGDSHSQIWGGSISSQVNGYDHSCWFQFAAELAKHGLTCKPSPLPQATYGTSGGTVSAYSGATRVNTKFSAVLSKRPSVIINLCGTNDVNRSDFNLSAFETDMKADINTLLAVDASTELLVLWTIPSLRGVLAEQSIAVQVQKKVQTAQANAVVAALPAWWDANNLGREGAVVVVDMHTAFGGEDSAGDSYISGTWNPAYYVSATARYGNDVHPSSKGRRVMARLLASAIVNSL